MSEAFAPCAKCAVNFYLPGLDDNGLCWGCRLCRAKFYGNFCTLEPGHEGMHWDADSGTDESSARFMENTMGPALVAAYKRMAANP